MRHWFIGAMLASALCAPSLARAEEPGQPLVRPPSSVARPLEADNRSVAKDPDDVVCKAPQATGTRLPKGRVCMRQQDWDLLEREMKRSIERGQEALLQAYMG